MEPVRPGTLALLETVIRLVLAEPCSSHHSVDVSSLAVSREHYHGRTVRAETEDLAYLSGRVFE